MDSGKYDSLSFEEVCIVTRTRALLQTSLPSVLALIWTRAFSGSLKTGRK